MNKQIIELKKWRSVTRSKTLDEFRDNILRCWQEFDEDVKIDMVDIFSGRMDWVEKFKKVIIDLYQAGLISGFMYNGETKFYKSLW